MPEDFDTNVDPVDFGALENDLFDEPETPQDEDVYDVEPEEPKEPWRLKDHVHTDKLPTAFWTVTGVISLVTSSILLVVVVIIGLNIFEMVSTINDDLVGELYTSFIDMDQAHILTTIPIESEVPAQFDLQLDTYTNVVLSEAVFINDANVSLSTGGLSISNAPTDITLPAGTELPVHLVLTVPVDEMIPVVMDVAVDIPIDQTQLHEPFQKLQNTIAPYYYLLQKAPSTMKEAVQSLGD